MPPQPPTIERPNSTILFGSPGPYTLSVLEILVSHNVPVSRVFCAGVAPAQPMEKSISVSQPMMEERLERLANCHRIPVSYISRPSDLLSPNLDMPEYPEYILVACFPFRLPETVFHRARNSCINIHPSLLPGYRGPDPIFWQLKNGEARTGVSLHVLTEDFDNGPIVRQKKISYPDGAYKKDIETRLGREGAKLYVSLLADNLPADSFARTQDETISSYYLGPTITDYQLSPDWSARQAFNFIRGTWPPVNQHVLRSCTDDWIITQALDFSGGGEIPEPVSEHEGELYIQFSPGILHARGMKT